MVLDDGGEWRFTSLYGEPNWEQKERPWDALRSLHGAMSLPWIVLGVYNEILFDHEKEGGRPMFQRHLQAFHSALTDCELSDLGFLGDKFTWQRGQKGLRRAAGGRSCAAV